VTWSIEVDFPSPFAELTRLLSFFSFDFLSLECVFQHSNHFLSVYLWSVAPLCVAALLVILHMVQRVLAPARDASAVSSRKAALANRLLLLGYLVLPPVTLKQLQGLDCVNIANRSYLRIDTSIDCDSHEFKAFRVINGLFLLAYLSTPLVWLFLLVARRHRLNPAPTTGSDKRLALFVRAQDEGLRPLRFLFGAYEPSMFYMEIIEM
jgi:hypothetical protein